MKSEVSARAVLIPILLAVLAIGGFFAYRKADAWQEEAARKEVTKHAEPPTEWKGLR
ncbi:MAG: hypothetical protein R3C19_19605 [Planctomycetaceae bacterium]